MQEAQPEATTTAVPVQEKKAEATPGASGGGARAVQHSTGQGQLPARMQSTEVIQFEAAAAAAAAELVQFAGGGTDAVHQAAAEGISGATTTLPHAAAIQHSFGSHDVSGIEAHTDSAASQANEAMGSRGFATGNHVAFGAGGADLHTSAHEAAHVVQQRGGVQLKGGVGSAGDTYEQHADAVADRVVQGKSAQDLLDSVAPATATSSGGGVQHAVQHDIKSDLHEAIDGWGTDEDAIFNRLGRATPAEIQEVLDDAALMRDLRGDLDQGDMSRVLDLLRAPLATKLRLAMDGWGTDEAYIHRAMLNATPAELEAVANDAALVDQLEGELSGDDLRTVLNRLNVPLARKLQYAVAGWGTDEQFIFDSIQNAPLGQVQALANDATMVATVDGDLSGEELNRWRGLMARRIWLEANDGVTAFKMIDGNEGERTARLAWVGDITIQRALLDAEITTDTVPAQVINAFQSYWAVEIGVQDGANMSQWPIAVLQNIHAQLKLLPDQDSRGGFWRRMSLSDASLIDTTSGNEVGLKTRAAYNDAAGNFIVGTGASATSNIRMGYETVLTAAATAKATSIQVEEGGRLAVGDQIKIGRNTTWEQGVKIQGITGNTWTLDSKLVSNHNAGEKVQPDDGSGARDVNWLAATVRHEIAHGVDANVGVSPYTAMGGWWVAGSAGGDFDTWANAMGNPWAVASGAALTEAEKGQIKSAIIDATSNRKGSLYGATLNLAATHPIKARQADNIPVVRAAEACLSQGDGHTDASTGFYRNGGKAFTINYYYRKFMYFNEAIIDQRVSNYSLYAPTEFFAEAYTVFYEEAGKAGVTDADFGRLIRNQTWASWIRTHIHERGHAPAGTGASGTAPGAAPGSASVGRAAGNPGA